MNPGTKPNNDDFSDCSKDSIALNIDAILDQVSRQKPNCFKDKLDPVCGNQVVEGDEECDCGATDEECKQFNDHCCSSAASGDNACKLKDTAKCSPSNGPCCNHESCDFFKASDDKICGISTECASPSYCAGNNATCPPPIPCNATFCAMKTKMCDGISCSKSVCSKIGYAECQEDFDKKEDSSRYCYLSCSSQDDLDTCINSLEPDSNMKRLLDELNDGKALVLPPGSPCDNYRGV